MTVLGDSDIDNLSKCSCACYKGLGGVGLSKFQNIFITLVINNILILYNV